ncbi:MAG: hypothetical protein IKI31_06260, partial [Treponema sp.]|nr:hypothetical protein [Treponema sp.]
LALILKINNLTINYLYVEKITKDVDAKKKEIKKQVKQKVPAMNMFALADDWEAVVNGKKIKIDLDKKGKFEISVDDGMSEIEWTGLWKATDSHITFYPTLKKTEIKTGGREKKARLKLKEEWYASYTTDGNTLSLQAKNFPAEIASALTLTRD